MGESSAGRQVTGMKGLDRNVQHLTCGDDLLANMFTCIMHKMSFVIWICSVLVIFGLLLTFVY